MNLRMDSKQITRLVLTVDGSSWSWETPYNDTSLDTFFDILYGMFLGIGYSKDTIFESLRKWCENKINQSNVSEVKFGFTKKVSILIENGDNTYTWEASVIDNNIEEIMQGLYGLLVSLTFIPDSIVDTLGEWLEEKCDMRGVLSEAFDKVEDDENA